MCQNLFEKSGPQVETARFLSNPPPSLELNAYSVAINAEYCWVTIPLDVQPAKLNTDYIPFSSRATIKTSAATSEPVAARLEQCREYYKVGSGVRFGPGLSAYTDVTEATRLRRAVIAAVVEFPSVVGQCAGALEELELKSMCDPGVCEWHCNGTQSRNRGACHWAKLHGFPGQESKMQ